MNTKKLIDTIVVTGCAAYVTTLAYGLGKHQAHKEHKKIWNDFEKDINVILDQMEKESEPK